MKTPLTLCYSLRWKLFAHYLYDGIALKAGLISLLICCYSFAYAQPTLVKDINTAQSSELSQHENLINFNGSLFFTAFSPTFGIELWKSDGGEPILIKDITPGSAGSTISNLTVVNNTLFFTANTSGTDAQSAELWKTDGTLAGTVIVKDIKPGTAGSSPQNLVSMNGTLFFSADDGANGRELWKSNGTTAGTTLVKDITPATVSEAPTNLVHANGVLFFTVGGQLWKSNGTATGTLLVKEIGSGSNPGRLTNAGGTLFFTAYEIYVSRYDTGDEDDDYDDRYTTDGSFQLWKSDGTTNGTINIKTIQIGQNWALDSDQIDVYPVHLKSVGNSVFFSVSAGNYEFYLYKSDGTPDGTSSIKTISDRDDIRFDGFHVPLFVTSDNILYFKSGTELMRSDGTTEGTYTVTTTGVNIQNITTANGKLYLGGAVYQKMQLWQSDGTAEGTNRIKDIETPGEIADFSYLTYAGNSLYFIEKNFENSLQLWKSDGTQAGTIPVKSTYPPTENSAPLLMGSLNGTLFFSADNGANGRELWKSNGTTVGTTLVKDITPGPQGYDFGYSTVLNNSIFFPIRAPAPIGEGYALWKSDGTAAGTALVMPGSHSIGTLTNVNGTLFFGGAADGDLYKINETATGVVLVKDLMPMGCCPNSTNYTDVNGTLFFTAENNSLPTSFGLWKSDGTEAGTTKIKDIIDNGLLWTYNVVNVNGTVYFTANGQLWKSNGTTEGTIKVKEMPSGVDYRQIKYLTNVNGTLFFVAQNTFQDGWELWKSDGTEAGTVQVKDINPNGSSSPMHLTNVNGTLFFTAVDDKEGTNRELWKSDGTAEGTIKLTNSFVKQEFTYEIISPIVNLINVNGRLYFTANDGKTGIELWTSDGTTAGTNLVSDLFPGSEGAQPSQLMNVNGVLYFTANDGKTGIELWKYNPATCVGVPATNLILQGSNVCIGQDGKITIKASQANVRYQAFINNAALGVPVTGGGDISLTIPAVSLTVGNNIISVKANGCVVATLNSSATVTVTSTCENLCSATGSILREYWANVQGIDVNTIPVNTAPTSSTQLTSFEAPTNAGNNYGQRIRGYLCVPQSGTYTFYIAGDDNAELYLSTDDNPGNKTKIAYLTGANRWTAAQQWTKFATQKSAAINLIAGKKYYIEALHKEGLYSDHLTVGWQSSPASPITVIPGSALSPFIIQNTGKISREYWANVTGALVSEIPVNTTPTSVSEITSFETTTNAGNNYGQRIRGYVHPQVSGNYRFYIAGDDRCELWLSSDQDPAKKEKIASVSYFAGVREWNKYSAQQSIAINLVAGRKYYIEALHKEGNYGDNLAVGWQLPNQTTIAVIAGSYLSPFLASPTSSIARMSVEESATGKVSIYPNPFENTLTLNSSQSGRHFITIVDNLGRVVYQTMAQADTELDLAHLKAGVYVVKVTAENGTTQVLKVVKK